MFNVNFSFGGLGPLASIQRLCLIWTVSGSTFDILILEHGPESHSESAPRDPVLVCLTHSQKLPLVLQAHRSEMNAFSISVPKQNE